MTDSRRKNSIQLILLIAACASVAAPASQPAAGPVAATPRFAFHSDFAANLHDALLEAGRDRNFQRPALFEEGDEAACFGELPDFVRAAWSQAVGYYAEVVSSSSWTEQQQFVNRLELVGLGHMVGEGARPVVEIGAAMRAAAAPAYQACRWPAQDAENRRWIDQVMPLLEAHGEAIADRIGELYARPLGGLPIRVDVVETVNWSGANTIFLMPEGGHIFLSNETPEGPESLETVFHEASHTLMSPRSPVPRALEEASNRLEVPLPRDLWHGLLFVTTGEAVREALAAAGEPAYEPMTYAQGIFEEFHDVLQRAWTAYLDGDRSLEEATEELVRAVSEGDS